MLRSSFIGCFLIAIFLFLGLANLGAQDQVMRPPPIPDVLPPPPPDPDLLPPPPPLAWQPLAPKDADDESIPVAPALVPAPQAESSIAPPPPPVVETILPGLPDPAAANSAKPDVEIWRDESVQPQIPPRVGTNRLKEALVTGDAVVTLRVQFDPSNIGKNVFVRPGHGVVMLGNAGSFLPITSPGECVLMVQMAPDTSQSHIIFYCQGVRTILPLTRSTLPKVLEAEDETGGG